MGEETLEKYDLFISYYSGSGIDFARHLKKRLLEFGIKAFLDEKDIPKSIKRDTDEWRSHINRALLNSDKFVLIMTLGFNIRKEVIRELELAIDYNKERIFCKHNELPNSELSINIKNKIIDLSKYQYISFNDEPDLLRKLGAELIGLESSKKEESIFIKNIKKLIDSEGNKIREQKYPMMEIIIGPTNTPEIWLEINKENKDLIYFLDNFIYSKYVRVTRKWYEFDTYSDNEYCRVHVNGFFHIIKHFDYDDKRDLYYIDLIISHITQFLLSCITIMKYKSIEKEYSIYIILRNIENIRILYGPIMGDTQLYRIISLLYRNIKKFSNETNEVIYKYSFNPSNKWSDIKEVIMQIYKEIFLDLDVIESNDTEINKRIHAILKNMYNTNTSYNRGNITINKINIEEFEFTKEEMGIK